VCQYIVIAAFCSSTLLVSVASQDCSDIDSHACVLLEHANPHLCNDTSLSHDLCPRYCNLCRTLTMICCTSYITSANLLNLSTNNILKTSILTPVLSAHISVTVVYCQLFLPNRTQKYTTHFAYLKRRIIILTLLNIINMYSGFFCPYGSWSVCCFHFF